MREETARALAERGMDPGEVERIIQTALLEDLGPDWTDVTSIATIPPDQIDTAEIVARAPGVIAGLDVARAVFETVERLCGSGDGPRTRWVTMIGDGTHAVRGTVLATISGPTRVLLMGERTALNLVSRMSGVATHTAAWAAELTGTRTTVLDTRKTTPGLRTLEKYAVRAGGGTNKRMGLYDVAMIKDNHKLAAGSITAAFDAVRRTYPDITIQVEVTTEAEAREAVAAGADFLLLDNMEPAEMRAVVTAVGDRAELEATGGLTLEMARKVAETGVDFISVGGLTHSSPIIDIALDLSTRGTAARDDLRR